MFGPAMGRPKSAVFRTADIVGLDTMAHVLATIGEGCPDDPWRDRFEMPEAMQALIDDGRLGSKSGAGFYKKVKTEAGSTILSLDLETLDYVDAGKVRLAAVGAARKMEEPGDKIAAMTAFDDDHGRFAWKVTAESSIYALELLGQIADDIVNIDRALRWGFNYELGPFEAWDAIGVADSVERMRAEGMTVARGRRPVDRGGRRLLVREARRPPVLLGRRIGDLPDGSGVRRGDHHRIARRRRQGPRRERGSHPVRHGRRCRVCLVPHEDERPRQHHSRGHRRWLRHGRRRRTRWAGESATTTPTSPLVRT